jgi:hypothetical protein
MIDFIVGCALGIPFGFFLGCIFVKHKNKNSGHDYDFTVIREEIYNMIAKIHILIEEIKRK